MSKLMARETFVSEISKVFSLCWVFIAELGCPCRSREVSERSARVIELPFECRYTTNVRQRNFQLRENHAHAHFHAAALARNVYRLTVIHRRAGAIQLMSGLLRASGASELSQRVLS